MSQHQTIHLGPGEVVYLARNEEAFRAACGEDTEPRYVVEEPYEAECDACLDLAARPPHTYDLADCPTVEDFVEATDALRGDVILMVNDYVGIRRITDVLDEYGDRVVVCNDAEHEQIEQALIAYVDAEADQ